MEPLLVKPSGVGEGITSTGLYRPSGVSWRFVALCALAVAALTALVFGVSVGFGFVDWDDYDWIVNNCKIAQPSLLHGLWLFIPQASDYYQPLVYLGWMLDVALAGGLDPGVMHLHNLVVYGLGCVAACVFALRFLTVFDLLPQQDRPLAALAWGLLFLAHPVHVESVVWLTERKDALAVLWGFASLSCVLRSAADPDTPRWRQPSTWGALVFYVLLVLSKGYGAVFAAAFWLLEFSVQLRRGRWQLRRQAEYLPFLLLLLVSVVFYASLNEALYPVQDAFARLSGWQRASLVCNYMAQYAAAVFLPFDLSYAHLMTPARAAVGWPTVAGAAVMLGWAGLGLWALKRRRGAVLFLAGFAAIYLAPGSGAAPLVFANRYLLFPVLAPLGALVWLAFTLRRRLFADVRPQWLRVAPLAVLALVLCLLSMETRLRAPVWHNSEVFFLDNYRHHKGDPFAAQLVVKALSERKPRQALAFYRGFLQGHSSVVKFRDMRRLLPGIEAAVNGPRAGLATLDAYLGDFGPDDPPLLRLGARLAWQEGDEAKAVAYLGMVPGAATPDGASRDLCPFFVDRAKEAISQGRFDRALHALEYCPDPATHPLAGPLAAVARFAPTGDNRAILEVMGQHAAAWERSPVFHQTLSQVFANMGRTGEAGRALQRLKELEEASYLQRCWASP